MSNKDAIDQALIAAAEKKSPQAKLLRRHFEAISLALEGGMKMAEVIEILKERTGVTFGLRWSYEVIESERKKLKQTSVTSGKPTKPNTPTPSIRVIEPAPAPVTAPLVSAASAATNPTSGWELEHQDAIIPPELLNKAFTEIAGISVDLRQPCPHQFGEQGEEVKHKVNPSSPNWPEYKARARARITYAQDLSYWQREFKKWLISQGYTGVQY